MNRRRRTPQFLEHRPDRVAVMTAKRTVTTQQQLDAALADSNVTNIDIDSPRGEWLELSAHDSARVTACGRNR